MTEDAKNIVRTTIRMDAALHDQLRDLVHELGKGLPKRERPSLDLVVQEAVRARLANPLPSQQNEGKPLGRDIERPITSPQLLLELPEIYHKLLAISEKLDLLLELSARGKHRPHPKRLSAREEAERVIAHSKKIRQGAEALISHKKEAGKGKAGHPKVAGA